MNIGPCIQDIYSVLYLFVYLQSQANRTATEDVETNQLCEQQSDKPQLVKTPTAWQMRYT